MMNFAAPAEMPRLVRRSLISGRPVVVVSCVVGAVIEGVLVGIVCRPS